jgi:hypothetical protein
MGMVANGEESLLAVNEVQDNMSPKPHSSQHSLIRTIVKMFGWELCTFHLLSMINVICKMTNTQLLRYEYI